MTEILYRWLDEELRIPVARDADTFLQQFSNGQLIGKILNIEGVLPDKKFDQLRTNDLYEDRLHNFLVIGPYMKSLGVNLSVRQARDILSDRPGSLTYLIYQVYLALHRPRDHLRQPEPEPLPDAYRERLRESARPDLRDSGVTGLGLTCQCYGREVTQTRVIEGHLVKECQQRITKEGVRKKEKAKEIKKEMTEDYMKGDSAKLWGRSFRSTLRSASRREKDRQKAEAAAVRQQIQQFDTTADLRRSKYEDVRNAEFLQTTVTPDMIPEALVNTEANQQFVHKLRNQLERDTRARFDREKRRKQMYLALRDQQRRQEEDQRELDLVRRLLRQGDYELRLAAHLTDIKRHKQIIIRNRLEKDQRMKERRQQEYERSVKQELDLLGQKRMEHQEELLKESQLHRRLLQQRREQKTQRRWQLAADVVTFCLDMAVLTVDYKTKSGDPEIPASIRSDWRQLFLRGESLSGGGEPAELSATTVPGEQQQALLQQQDLAEYLAVSGPWVIPTSSGKKRSASASAHARDDHALRVEAAVVTGFVVHRLLRLVYPPKPSVQAPERPTFTLMGVVMGKSYTGKSHCLQWVQSVLDVRHIVMHDLVKRSLETLERETQMELEAAGSGVMETLRIADILGPDLSKEEMERQDLERKAQEQRQGTASDGLADGEGQVESDKDAALGTEEQIGQSSAGVSPDDHTEEQSKAQKETEFRTKLEQQESKENSKNSITNSENEARTSDKSKDPSKSAYDGTEKNGSSQQQSDAEDGTTEFATQVTTDSAKPDQTSSEIKQKISLSTKDISSSEQTKSKTSLGGGCVSDEDTSSVSDEVVQFEYSRLAELGREVKHALEHGEEVHDQTLADLLLEAWRELPDDSGWIIEGFPNTLAQAELLEEQLVGKQYDSDEELDEVEIVVTPLPKPEPPEDSGDKDKGKKGKKGKDGGKKGKKGKAEPPLVEEAPPPPPPPPEPVRLKVKPFRRSQLVPDPNRRERPPPTSGLDLVVELVVSDEVAQQRRCQHVDRVSEQPNSGNCQSDSDDHVTLAGKLFNYGGLREPLVEFYGERGVYHQVDADDLAYVESQLEQLIGASREKQREELRLAERRAAKLAAAENEPDSEPEPEPEPEPEAPVPGKGKGKAKSPKGGKRSGDAKGKKGKGKGKGGAEQTAAAEELPQIPAPPPMPAPGEIGYYFVDSPVPEGVAQYLALLWQQTERNYTENLKQWLGRLRLEHAAVIHHLHAITVSFSAFLLRPDHKQQFLNRFVMEYNQMEEALQCDEEAKCEWHLRIQELESAIWNITDTRRCEAEQERYTIMTSGWIEDRLALSANNWLMVMQTEMDRFQDTSLVLEDYYVGMSGSQLPENNGRIHGFRQAMIEIPSREPADLSGVSSAGSERHSGSRSSSSARPLRRGGRPGEGAASTGSGVLATVTLPQLRPRVQFVRGKNQADEVTTAVEGVIESACRSMLSFVHDAKEKADTRVRLGLLPAEETAGGKKGAKKSPAPKAKAAKKGAAGEEEGETEGSKQREAAERALAEYQVVAREESSRVSARLALIRARAVSELAALRHRAVVAFQGMWSAIEERYRRELQAATDMADFLRGAVERQQRLHYQLLLDQDRFLVRTGVLTHLPCLPTSPPPPEEALLRDRVSLLQAAGLWRQLHTAAPTGTITTRAFCFILQDLVACGVGTQELPELWMALSQEEIESFSARIAAGEGVMSWRGLLYDLLEPWSRPDQYDLHEALAIAHVFDPERTGKVTHEQALQVVHWMKPRLEDCDETYNRPYHTKRLLVDISGAPGDQTVDYQTLLLWLCRGEDVLQSFLCALTVLEDTPIFISNPEDSEKYYPRRKVDLARIQSLPMQKITTSPRPDNRPRKVRLTQSAPLDVRKEAEDNEGSEEQPREVVLQATCSTAYNTQDSLEPTRPPSRMVSGGAGDRLGSSLENLPPETDSGEPPPDSATSRRSLEERPGGSGSEQTVTSSAGQRGADSLTSVPEVDSAVDSARSQVLDELTISVPTGHTLDSWTALAPSCCTHPAEAPPATPSTDERAATETGNKSTLNAIRAVLATTMVLPVELMPHALQRLDLDLSLVYRDLFGGACGGTVEALHRGQPLPVPILAVLRHDLTQRYLAAGRCTLLAGRPWQLIKDVRSPPPPPPPPAPLAAAQTASVTGTGTGTSTSFRETA